MIRKLAIISEHEAGVWDSLKKLVTGGTPTIKDEAAWEKFKTEVLRIYKRVNNAYKIYLQGVPSKNYKITYQEKIVTDKDGKKYRKKVKVQTPGKKIDFSGNWDFWLDKEHTTLGKALKYLYDFIQKAENTQYEVKKAGDKPAQKPPAGQKPPEQPKNQPNLPGTEEQPAPAQKPGEKTPPPNRKLEPL